MHHRFPVGRARDGLARRPDASRQPLCPTPFAMPGVMGQPFDLFEQAVGIESLDGVHDAGMEGALPFLQEAAVGHLMGERVLERVRRAREEPRLVEELGGLEVAEPGLEFFFGEVGNGLEEPHGDLVPMTAAVCSRRFSTGGSRSRRAASTASIVSGTASGACSPPCSTTFQVNYSKKKGFPAAFVRISSTIASGTAAVRSTACTTVRLSPARNCDSAIWVAYNCASQGE